MASRSLPTALSTFSYLRLRGRRVYSALSNTYLSDVSGFLRCWVQSTQSTCKEPFDVIFVSVIQDTVAKLERKDEQFLACWLVCAVFARSDSSAATLFWACRGLRATSHALLSSLYLSGTDDSKGVQCGKLDVGRAAKCISSSITLQSKEDDRTKQCNSHRRAETEKDRTQAPAHCTPGAGPARASLSLLLPESRELSQLLKLCKVKAAERKYIRGCFIRQLDDCLNFQSLVSAVRESRIDVFFVQRKAGRKVVEFLTSHSVLCIDRLGKEVADRFGTTLNWQVFESMGEWLLSSKSRSWPKCWKFWLDTKHAKKGLRVTIRLKGIGHSLITATVISSPLNASNEQTLVADRAIREPFNEKLLRDELLLAWGKSFLVPFHIGVATLLLQEGCDLSHTEVVSRVLESRVLESVLDAVSFLCRYQL